MSKDADILVKSGWWLEGGWWSMHTETTTRIGGYPLLLSLLILMYSAAYDDVRNHLDLLVLFLLSTSTHGLQRLQLCCTTSFTYIWSYPVYDNEIYFSTPGKNNVKTNSLCASITQRVALSAIGSIYYQIDTAYKFGMVVLTIHCSLPDLISVNTHINHNTPMK